MTLQTTQESETMTLFIDKILSSLQMEKDWALVENPRRDPMEDGFPILENKILKVRIRNLCSGDSGKFYCWMIVDGEKLVLPYSQRERVWNLAFPLKEKIEAEKIKAMTEKRDIALSSWLKKFFA